ncbi:CocE/NonD family hydrolase [Pseudalkalibacillus hwajinpoensis]|uniref:CocE/NonD family hydrolase n=1 Tax=Guptibacillus hwajinpoensis TaxID=208199 RepID=UPI00325B0A7E
MEIIVEMDVACTLRDGTTLYANVYRPSSVEKYPVLLTRLPYNKNLPDFPHRYIDPLRLARSGYVIIIQDVRGRFASEGDFKPFVQEAEDGYDTVEWAAALPYSNGRVGMFGLSYYGFTQLYAAVLQPPSLKAIFPVMTGSNLQEGLAYRGGAFELGLVETWMLDSIAADYLNRIKENHHHLETIHHDLNHIFEWHKYKPVKEWPPLWKYPSIGHLFNKLADPEDSIHMEADITNELKNIDVSSYHIAGWYDCFLGSTLTNYQEMKKSGEVDQKLMIGPWGHGDFNAVIGDRFFGSHCSGSSLDLTGLHLNWFDRWLKGHSPETNEDKPVHIFVMGINDWRAEEEWPLKRAQYVPYYLQRPGSFSIEKGKLSTKKSESIGTDSFIFDPEHPVPTQGGGTLFYQGMNMGPKDQRGVSDRDDVLVYTTEPLSNPLEVTGPIKVELIVSSDVTHTDFTATLVDVLPDGTSYNLADGMARLEGLRNEPTRIVIDLWATSNVFLEGHTIGLHITSSNFPRYDVNPNTGKSTFDSWETKKAHQKVYYGPIHESCVYLPIIPNRVI